MISDCATDTSNLNKRGVSAIDNQRKPEFPFNNNRIYYGYIVVAAAFLIMLSTYGTRYIFGVFLKPMLDDMSWTRAITSGAFSLSSAVQGLLSVLAGFLNDKLGPRIVLTICGFLLGAGYLLMSQVSQIWQLYAFYGLVIGTGMAGVWIPLTSTLTRWFTNKRGLMTGIVLSGTGIGSVIGAPVASWLIFFYDWRMSYIVMGVLVLVMTIPAAQFLKREPTKPVQIMCDENKLIKAEKRSIPITYSIKDAVHIKQFWFFFMAYFCFGFVLFAMTIHIVPYATDLGMTSAVAASILATASGTSIAGRLVFGNIADRIGTRLVYIIGFSIMFIVSILLLISTNELTLYLFAGLFGFAQGGMGMASSILVAWLFGLSSHGLIYAVISLGYAIGSTCGPFFTGYIFDITGSYYNAFLLCATIAILGLILTIILKPISTGQR